MSACDSCSDGTDNSGSLIVSGNSATISIASPTSHWRVGMYVSVDQFGGVTSVDDSIVYLFTPIWGRFKITAFSPYYSGVAATGSPPINASMSIELPPGDALWANAYAGKTTLDGMTSTAHLLAGMAVTGPGIAAGTFILDIPDSQSVVLTKKVTMGAPPAPQSAYGEYTFTPNYQAPGPDSNTADIGDFGGRQIGGGIRGVVNVTNRFSSIQLNYSGTCNYYYSVSGGDSTRSEDLPNGTTFTESSSSSQSATVEGYAAGSDSLSPYAELYTPGVTSVPPGQFVVLKSDDCCARCFYVILYTPPIGATLFNYAPNAWSLNMSADQSSLFTTTGAGGSTASNDANVSVGVTGALTGSFSYQDNMPACRYNGDTSNAGILSVSVAGTNQPAGGGVVGDVAEVITGNVNYSASPTPPTVTSRPATLADLNTFLGAVTIANIVNAMTNSTPATPPTTPEVEYLNDVPDGDAAVDPCSLAGSYTIEQSYADPQYNRTVTAPGSSSSGTSGGVPFTETTTAKVTSVSLTGSSTIVLSIS